MSVQIGQQIKNAMAVSFGADGEKLVVPWSCEECGEYWTRADQCAGARYFFGERWLCSPCCVSALEAEIKRPGV